MPSPIISLGGILILFILQHKGYYPNEDTFGDGWLGGRMLTFSLLLNEINSSVMNEYPGKQGQFGFLPLAYNGEVTKYTYVT